MQASGEKYGAFVDEIEASLQAERIRRYRLAAHGDRRFAFELYEWNLHLAEAFLVPLHYAEVTCRNSLNRALLSRLGNRWFNDETFRALLDPHHRSELVRAIHTEQRQHRDATTANHIVSALPFGFWQHLVTRRFGRLLWPRGVSGFFRGAPESTPPATLQVIIEATRRWRNRIAHHQAIFDRAPMRHYQDALTLIRWSCPATARYVASVSRVPAALAARPRRPA